MGEIIISKIAELKPVLARATGGDVIKLAPATYEFGATLKRLRYPDYVTISSVDPANPARICGRVRLKRCNHLRLENLFLENPSRQGGTAPLEVSKCSNIQIRNNKIEGGHQGAEFFEIEKLEVSGNRFNNVVSDSMKFGGVMGFLIANNFGAATITPTPGVHVDFIQFQGPASDGAIRGNVLLPAWHGSTAYQGIFMGKGPYSGITIEDNLIYNNAVNGIAIKQGAGIIVRRNTVLTMPGVGHKKSTIRFVRPAGRITLEDNVSNGESRVTAQYSDPAAPDYYNAIYRNAMAGLGATIEDFRPVPGGAADFGTGIGAERRIAELLGVEKRFR